MEGVRLGSRQPTCMLTFYDAHLAERVRPLPLVSAGPPGLPLPGTIPDEAPRQQTREQQGRAGQLRAQVRNNGFQPVGTTPHMPAHSSAQGISRGSAATLCQAWWALQRVKTCKTQVDSGGLTPWLCKLGIQTAD